MDREAFLALLARLLGEGDPLTAAEFADFQAGISEHATDDELAQIEAGCQALGEDDNVPLETVRAAVGLVEAVRGEAETRMAAAEAERSERETLRAQLAGEVVDSNIEDNPDGGDPPAEDPPATDPPAEDPPADPAADPAPEGDPAAAPADQVPVAAAAAAAAPTRTVVAPRAAASAQRRPAGQVVAPQRRTHNRIVRDGGGEFDDLRAASEEMLRRRESFLSANNGIEEKVPVASILADYPETRRLDGQDAARNAALLSRLVNELDEVNMQQLEAVTAAGGFCAPVTPFYGIPRISEADRPVRDSLIGYQAVRGGITYRPPPDFTAFNNGVSQWTKDNDTLPGSAGPATKPCLTVPCLPTETAYLYAVVECLKFGNFMTMADPETVQNATENTMAAFARKAETLLLDAMKTASTAVDAGQIFGAFRDLLYHWGVSAARYRSHRRMRSDAVLELRAPSWVRDMIREDVARSLNAYADQLAMADDFIARALAVRNIRPFWYIDSPSVTGTGTNFSQVMGSQPAGAVVDFPEYVQWQMSPPGTFLFLENGRLDLGIVRDSALNATNDYQTFAETFEGLAHPGFQSIWGTSTVCPNGASAGTTSPDSVCTSGGQYIPTGSGIGAFVAP